MKQATARAAANWRRVYAMPVASVYPSYIAKAEMKGRTRAEVDEIFRGLTGHSQASLEAEFAKKTSFEDFFAHAPKMNPSRFLITGVVCGVRVEEIQEPMMREIRYLDKLIDLAEKFQMTLTGMKKHVSVLEQAGLVTTEKVGRVRICKLGPRRLQEETAWIERYRQLWNSRFDELDKVVEELKQKEMVDGRKKRE